MYLRGVRVVVVVGVGARAIVVWQWCCMRSYREWASFIQKVETVKGIHLFDRSGECSEVFSQSGQKLGKRDFPL
jgi:hypothetical protein